QPDCLHYLGLICMQKGDEKQAENYIRKSIDLASNPVYYSNYGMFLGKQGRHKDAIKQYFKAVELQPDYAEAWFNLGVSLGQDGNLQEAEKAYIKAVTLKNNYIKAMYNLACVQEAQGKSDEAGDTLSRIQEITPDSADMYFKMGLAMQY